MDYCALYAIQIVQSYNGILLKCLAYLFVCTHFKLSYRINLHPFSVNFELLNVDPSTIDRSVGCWLVRKVLSRIIFAVLDPSMLSLYFFFDSVFLCVAICYQDQSYIFY